MSQSVTWLLSVGSVLADFVTGTVIDAGGSDYKTAGLAGQWIWFSNDPDAIAFAGDGHTLVSASTARSVSFYASESDPALITVTGITANLFEFYGTHLANSPQDAIDWLFGTVVGAGSTYIGGIGAQVFEPFGTGDGLVGNSGDDVFQLGRIAGITRVAYIHGDASDGTSLDGTDAIEFVGNYTGSIDVATQVDKIVFDVAAAPIFKLSGTSSWLPSTLAIEMTPEVTAMTVAQSTATAADFDFSGWDVSGGTLGLTINTSEGDHDDVVRAPIDWDVTATIDTFDGDDTIYGGGGYATIAGGAGWDLLTYEWRTANGVEIDVGYHQINVFVDVGSFTSNTVMFSGIEEFRGTRMHDNFAGDGTGKTFEGLAEMDTFYGVAGSDIISYSHETEFGATLGIVVNLGPSSLDPAGAIPFDVDAAGRAALVAVLDDTLVVSRHHIRDGFGFSDNVVNPVFIIEGSTLADFMVGDAANDTLRGFDGEDWIYGEADDDRLFGEEGADRLFGGAGADLLSGGNGNDTLDGAAGSNDGSVFGLGDTLQGDGGTDTVSYAGAKGAVTANLATPSLNKGEAWHDLYSSIENLAGSAFGDTLIGNTLGNLIIANAGNDTLTGNGGTDTLCGGAGDDTYLVSHALTDVDEGVLGSNGIDTVRSTVTFNLSNAHVKGTVENLVLTNTVAATTGTGNGAANVLDGSLTARANTLTGLGGSDT